MQATLRRPIGDGVLIYRPSEAARPAGGPAATQRPSLLVRWPPSRPTIWSRSVWLTPSANTTSTTRHHVHVPEAGGALSPPHLSASDVNAVAEVDQITSVWELIEEDVVPTTQGGRCVHVKVE